MWDRVIDAKAKESSSKILSEKDKLRQQIKKFEEKLARLEEKEAQNYRPVDPSCDDCVKKCSYKKSGMVCDGIQPYESKYLEIVKSWTYYSTAYIVFKCFDGTSEKVEFGEYEPFKLEDKREMLYDNVNELVKKLVEELSKKGSYVAYSRRTGSSYGDWDSQMNECFMESHL